MTTERVRELLDAAAGHTDDAAARELALAARVTARAADDRCGEAAALFHLATLSHAAGRDDTFALAVEAADVAAEAGDAVTAARSEQLLAVVHLAAGNHAEALDHAERAVEVYRRSDHRVHEMTLLNTVAAVHHAAGRDERAIEAYRSALRVGETTGQLASAAVVLGNIARIRSARAEHGDAVALGRRAVELAASHAPELASSLLADLAESYAGLADHEQAAVCIAEAREICRIQSEAGEAPPAATRLGVMLAEARLALARDDASRAIAVLGPAGDLARRAGLDRFEVEADDLLATAYRRAGRYEAALDARERHAVRSAELRDRAADLRLRTLRSTNAAVVARQRAEIFRLGGDDTGPFGVSRAWQRTGHHGDVDEVGDADDVAAGRRDPRVDQLVDRAAAVQLDAFERLAVLAEFRDADTGEHTRRVGDLAAEIAHAVGELPEWCERLRLAARLHDIGKVAVPDAVLLKSGPLTVDEFELMKSHTTVGHQILAGSASPLFQLAAELALTHHEWWDGHGYPHGRSGGEIPLSGRIVALADVFDALCSERAYKRAWPMAEAARFVVSGAGAQFDPDLVGAFVAVLVARHPQLAPELS